MYLLIYLFKPPAKCLKGNYIGYTISNLLERGKSLTQVGMYLLIVDTYFVNTFYITLILSDCKEPFL